MSRKLSTICSRILPGASAFTLALLGSVATSGAAQAQELCAADPQPVPFMAGPPCWDSTAGVCNVAGFALRTELNEPRWALSPRTNFWNNLGSDNSNEGGYRIVRHGNALYVSLQVTGDMTKTDSDSAQFALEFVNGAAIRRVAVRIPLRGTGEAFVYAGADATVDNWTSTGGTTWTHRRTAPSWLKSVASWKTQEVVEGGADWAIQFKVDLTSPELAAAAAIPNTAQFRAFMAVDGVELPGATELTVPAIAVANNYTKLANAECATNMADPLCTESVIPNDVSLWTPVFGLGARAACAPGLIVEGPGDIGTKNTDADMVVLNAGARNEFFAQMKLPPEGMTLNPGDLRARFRIANWGAQPEESNNTSLWKTVPQEPINPLEMGAPPSYADNLPRNGQYYDFFGFGTDPLRFEMRCPTNVPGQVCNLPIPTDPHQCMVVSIENVPGKPFRKISKASEFRNMRFQTLVDMPTVDATNMSAEISVQGLQAAIGNAPPTRDVYAKMMTRNMPAWGNNAITLDGFLMNLLKLAVVGLGNVFNPFGGLALSADDYIKAAWPTLEVHTYYDSGRTIRIKGVSYKRLRPMNSYGYYASHEGTFYGYNVSLDTPAGGKLPSMDGNDRIFKLQVPNEGKLKVNTVIMAPQTPRNGSNPLNLICAFFPEFCAQ